MKLFRTLAFSLIVMSLMLAACAPAATPTTAPAATQPAAATEAPTQASTGLTCAQPIKIGLITDMSGALAIYGTMIPRSFMLGM